MEGLLEVGEDRLEGKLVLPLAECLAVEVLQDQQLEDKMVHPLVECLAVEAPQDHQPEDKRVTWAKEILKNPKK